ncbi:undecaprenyl diphosphate synthase family protein [Streptomyces sp. XM4011]|nr:undecaprenyl diphosphate synthase family protein [Streptomyces sp. XM4011]MCK1814201.1 undecaprenyl diphosphate synthase family protein [Streptomyces sp. XM4011]
MTSTARTAAPPPVPAELLPRTVAVAMDGNGRWARARGLSRSEGHRAGAERLPELARAALEIGVRRLVVYGFSTENWRRSPQEVAGLMRLSEQALGAQRERLHAMGRAGLSRCAVAGLRAPSSVGGRADLRGAAEAA